MANPNNLVRPPVLNVPNAPEIERNLEETIARICAQQCQNAIRNFLDPDSDIGGEDQTIDDRYRNNLTDLDKVPDVVKCLKDFSGSQTEFSSWKKSVDRILKVYESIKGTPKYFAILNTIRNKITGNADAALEAYNTPLNWGHISKCLALHYADKRDLTTLEYQMSTLVQGNNTIQEYYQQVYSHLSLIMNKLSCMDISREAMDLLAQTYRDKALDAFTRGLRGNLSLHLGMKEPKDLPQALHLCLKMENQFARSNFANAHNQNNKNNTNKPMPQPLNRAQNQDRNRKPFYPQLAFMPQPSPNQYQYRPMNTTGYYNNFNQIPQIPAYQNPRFIPPRPTAPKPYPRPEPMDIDQSMRTRNINYMNRPAQNNQHLGKRPPIQAEQMRNPPKMQRNFHLDTEENRNTNDEYYQEQLSGYGNEEGLPTVDEYFQNQTEIFEMENQPEIEEYVDINFLDQ